MNSFISYLGGKSLLTKKIIPLIPELKQVAYIYTSKPRISLSHRSLPHDGAVVFDIIEGPGKKLTGKYWTDRKTKGEIILAFYSKSILEELPEPTMEHPATENEHLR